MNAGYIKSAAAVSLAVIVIAAVMTGAVGVASAQDSAAPQRPAVPAELENAKKELEKQGIACAIGFGVTSEQQIARFRATDDARAQLARIVGTVIRTSETDAAGNEVIREKVNAIIRGAVIYKEVVMHNSNTNNYAIFVLMMIDEKLGFKLPAGWRYTDGNRDQKHERTINADNQKSSDANKAGDLGSASVDPRSVKKGTMTDPRDKKKYRIVTIGKQTWMAENLNYKATVGSSCYDNKVDNCVGYGRLYDWDAALRACPAGWRLPDTADLRVLVDAVGRHGTGTRLKLQGGWMQSNNNIPPGTDDFSFSVLPGGFRSSKGFDGIRHIASFWSSTVGHQDAGVTYVWYLNNRTSDMVVTSISDKQKKDFLYSVRCIRE